MKFYNQGKWGNFRKANSVIGIGSHENTLSLHLLSAYLDTLRGSPKTGATK